MEIQEIQEFVALADNLNYSITAKQLFISRSVLSKHIQAMENELGIRLFIRDSHSVRLTEAGKMFAEFMREVLKVYNDAIKSVTALDKDISSLLHIGFLYATTGDYFPRACSVFRKANPDVRLSLHAMEVDGITEGVQKGELDFGLTILTDDVPPSGINYAILYKDRFGILVKRSHRLARFDTLTVSDLSNEVIYIPSATALPSTSRATRHILENAQCSLRVVDDINDIGSIKPILLAGDGVALTIGHIMEYFGSGFKFIPLEGVELVPRLVAIWKQSHESEPIFDFLRCLQDAYESRKPDYASDRSANR